MLSTIGFALRFWERPHGRAKTQGIHPSFPVFVRLSYAWLIVAGSMSVWAAFADVHGGIWGASRHALTVGFAATMVFAIGPRILPHFAGIQSIFSKRLMLLSLLCLQSGCLLRVSSEPLAYEGLVSFAWKVLPVSGMLELAGVLIFATNLALTFLIGRSAFAVNKPNQRLLRSHRRRCVAQRTSSPVPEFSSGCAQSYVAPSHDRPEWFPQDEEEVPTFQSAPSPTRLGNNRGAIGGAPLTSLSNRL